MRLHTLLPLMLGGLLITAGFIGWLGYSSSYHAIVHSTEQNFALANGATTREVDNFLNDSANRLLDELSQRTRPGMLSLNDAKALGPMKLFYLQLSFNTDPGIPIDVPGAEGIFHADESGISD